MIWRKRKLLCPVTLSFIKIIFLILKKTQVHLSYPGISQLNCLDESLPEPAVQDSNFILRPMCFGHECSLPSETEQPTEAPVIVLGHDPTSGPTSEHELIQSKNISSESAQVTIEGELIQQDSNQPQAVSIRRPQRDRRPLAHL